MGYIIIVTMLHGSKDYSAQRSSVILTIVGLFSDSVKKFTTTNVFHYEVEMIAVRK
jgi:hypothetical protein